MRRKTLLTLFALTLVAVAVDARQPPPPPPPPPSAHTLLNAAEIKWGEAPPAFERGASFAVISGDPGGTGPFVIRAKMPGGFKVMPHWHPTDENVTVISGTLAFGMGEQFNEASMTAVNAGGFAKMPANMNHYAMAKGATEIQVHGIGPFALTYVNPADDPRLRAAPAAKK